MIVIKKYGGSIIRNIKMLSVIKNNILKNYNPNNKYIIVLSAIKNLTNKLIDVSNEFNLDYLKDELIKEGENISCIGLYKELNKEIKTKIIYPVDINLQVDNSSIIQLNIKKLLDFFNDYNILIIPGFYGINEENETRLLPRNSSDTTALYIYNELVKNNISTECKLYKDEVLYQIDPKIKKSKHIEHISYDELDLIKEYNNHLISKEGMNIIINNKLPLSIINFFTNKKSEISSKESYYNLLGKYYQKGYIVKITNIKNNKIFNYINKVKFDIIDKDINSVMFYTNQKLLKHLQILKLIDSSIKYKVSNKYKVISIYKTNKAIMYLDNILEDIYETAI
mgnify:CR=1 FL=1